jgi:hypothetical protein
MVRIPLGSEHYATHTDSALKTEHCEKCGAEYAYVMTRTAEGSAFNPLFLDAEGAKRWAAARAQVNTQVVLASASDTIPCPRCGWFQKKMVETMRKRLASGMVVASCVFFLIGGVVAILLWTMLRTPPLPGREEVVGLMFLVGIAWLFGSVLGIVARNKRKRFAPNQSDVEERKAFGRRHAMLIEDLDRAGEAVPSARGPAEPTGPADAIQAPSRKQTPDQGNGREE